MSTEQAGAIIRIIYYILDLNVKTDQYFTPDYISEQYNELLKQSVHKVKIEHILEQFKKHDGTDGIKTLEDKSQLRVWLNKHTNTKPILWFEKHSGKYKIKTEHLKSLKDLMATTT